MDESSANGPKYIARLTSRGPNVTATALLSAISIGTARLIYAQTANQ